MIPVRNWEGGEGWVYSMRKQRPDTRGEMAQLRGARPLCKELCCRFCEATHMQGRGHTHEVSPHEGISEFLIKPPQCPCFFILAPGLSKPTDFVCLSVIVSVWSWPWLKPGMAISSLLPHMAASCLLCWPNPGGWAGPGAEGGDEVRPGI